MRGILQKLAGKVQICRGLCRSSTTSAVNVNSRFEAIVASPLGFSKPVRYLGTASMLPFKHFALALKNSAGSVQLRRNLYFHIDVTAAADLGSGREVEAHSLDLVRRNWHLIGVKY